MGLVFVVQMCAFSAVVLAGVNSIVLIGGNKRKGDGELTGIRRSENPPIPISICNTLTFYRHTFWGQRIHLDLCIVFNS